MTSIFNLPGARIHPTSTAGIVQNLAAHVAAGQQALAAAAVSLPTSLRGRLQTAAAVRQYIEAGRATLTLVSIKTGTRYTFGFKRPDAKPGEPLHARPIWVSLLSGPDNESNYTFLGTCFPDVPKGDPVPVGTPFRYRHSFKSKVSGDAPSVKALSWFLAVLYIGGGDAAAQAQAALLAQAECWHEGRCGRCGRTLTVPASIASGFGPECIQHV
jgi:hypothetical protein